MTLLSVLDKKIKHDVANAVPSKFGGFAKKDEFLLFKRFVSSNLLSDG